MRTYARTIVSIALATMLLPALRAQNSDKAVFPDPEYKVKVDCSKEPMQQGSFSPTPEGLSPYECPEWFKDAKFGDRFMTRDGHEAVLYDKTYIKYMGEFEYDLMVFIGEFDPDNWEVQQVCVRENGMCGDCEYEWDIVSKC